MGHVYFVGYLFEVERRRQNPTQNHANSFYIRQNFEWVTVLELLQQNYAKYKTELLIRHLCELQREKGSTVKISLTFFYGQ